MEGRVREEGMVEREGGRRMEGSVREREGGVGKSEGGRRVERRVKEGGREQWRGREGGIWREGLKRGRERGKEKEWLLIHAS